MLFTLKHQRIAPQKLSRAQLHYCPAIFDDNGVRWMVYRCQNSLRSPSWLAVSRFGPDGKIDWWRRLETAYHTAEDPRVVAHHDGIYVFYQTGATHWPKIAPDDWTVRCAQYDYSWRLMSDKPLRWGGRRQCEKNWCPFWHPETRAWYCVYSVQPWIVLRFNEDWECVDEMASTRVAEWPWGELRGGACPVRVLPPTGRFSFGALTAHYWAWMHSRYEPPKIAKALPQYVGLLMSFSADPPFAPTGISRRPIIQPDPKGKTVVGANVAYPAGAILQDGQWSVSYGHGDCECRIATVAHDEVTLPLHFRKL